MCYVKKWTNEICYMLKKLTFNKNNKKTKRKSRQSSTKVILHFTCCVQFAQFQTADKSK